MRLNLKYLGGDFKDIPIDKTITVCKFTEDKIAFNTDGTDKNAKEYEYKNSSFNDNVLEIITSDGTAKFKATEKQYQKFIKMIESKPERKINHPIAILVAVILVIAIGIHFGNNNSKPANTTNTTDTTQKASKPAAKTTTKPATKTTFADGTITEATVKDALKKAKGTNVIDINSKKEFKSISVIPNGNNEDKTVQIILKPQMGNETVLAKMMSSTIVNYAEILSKNKNIDKFILEFDEDFEDEYGKTSEGLAIWMEYSRETMNKIGYDNFKDSIYGDYTRAYKIADRYKIAQGIYNKLKNFNDLPASNEQ